MEFSVQRCSRQCSKTGRELKPGETFHSVLIVNGADIERFDFSQDAWEGPPPDALACWKSLMPDPHARKVHWAPNDVMLHYFEQLREDTGQDDVRYVLALLMTRRRIVRLEEKQHDEQGKEVLVLYCPRNENTYHVPVVEPSEPRIREVQEELARLLFANVE